MPTTILWHNRDGLGAERCVLTETPDGHQLAGVVLLAFDSLPARVEYRVELDANWLTRRVEVRQEQPSACDTLTLTADGAGAWWRDDAPLPQVAGCLDIDLGVSPSTNTLPIRRLQLQPGQRAQVAATWVRFPTLAVERLGQSYERLDTGATATARTTTSPPCWRWTPTAGCWTTRGCGRRWRRGDASWSSCQ